MSTSEYTTDGERELLVSRLKLMISADISSIEQLLRVNCRYCHGEDGKYQWVEHEYDKALVASEGFGPLSPKPGVMGGFGFNRYANPNKECKVCFGEGETIRLIKSHSELTESQKSVIKGFTVTKGEIKINYYDQIAAIKLLSEITGLKLDPKNIQSGLDRLEDLSCAQLKMLLNK